MASRARLEGICDYRLWTTEELIEAGKGIQIIDEAEFMRLIADAKNVLSADK